MKRRKTRASRAKRLEASSPPWNVQEATCDGVWRSAIEGNRSQLVASSLRAVTELRGSRKFRRCYRLVMFSPIAAETRWKWGGWLSLNRSNSRQDRICSHVLGVCFGGYAGRPIPRYCQE